MICIMRNSTKWLATPQEMTLNLHTHHDLRITNLHTHHDFVMKQGPSILLISLRPRREIVN